MPLAAITLGSGGSLVWANAALPAMPQLRSMCRARPTRP
jgi:hypothetical protein